MEQESDGQSGASAVRQTLKQSVVVKRGLSQKAKLSIYWSIYIPTFTYGHELWAVTERIRPQIQAAEMSFLCRVAGPSQRKEIGWGAWTARRSSDKSHCSFMLRGASWGGSGISPQCHLDISQKWNKKGWKIFDLRCHEYGFYKISTFSIKFNKNNLSFPILSLFFNMHEYVYISQLMKGSYSYLVVTCCWATFVLGGPDSHFNVH